MALCFFNKSDVFLVNVQNGTRPILISRLEPKLLPDLHFMKT